MKNKMPYLSSNMSKIALNVNGLNITKDWQNGFKNIQLYIVYKKLTQNNNIGKLKEKVEKYIG